VTGYSCSGHSVSGYRKNLKRLVEFEDSTSQKEHCSAQKISIEITTNKLRKTASTIR
jgi:hypothetical protein